MYPAFSGQPLGSELEVEEGEVQEGFNTKFSQPPLPLLSKGGG